MVPLKADEPESRRPMQEGRGSVKYYISTVFLRTRDVLELATVADELGYHGLALGDHVVNIEQISSRYPYTDDGRRRWQPFAE
jgi:hypothetical protein